MEWFFIALIGPILYAATNHIDKILLEKYFKVSGVGTLILFSSLLSALTLPFLFWFDNTIFDVDKLSVLVLAICGILNVLVLWFYLLALKDEEASIVVVFYQLVPVFGLVLAYFILEEMPTQMQIIAMSIIILGTTIISFEIDIENKFRLRKQTIFLMLAASFFWALESVLFKAVALEENIWRSLFWSHAMLALVGFIIFVVFASYRKNFLSALRTNSLAIISLNFGNETLYTLGNFALAFAYLLAPISLVLLTNSFQPIFVFTIGIFLTSFFPELTAEKIKATHLWQKLFAMIVTGIGTYILFIE